MAVAALKSGHSRFPVFEKDLDHIVGIVHVKDSFSIPMDQRDRVTVAKIMQDAFVVPETRNLDTLLLEMRRERRQMAIVVDEYGGTAGVITLEDLLEEIVGEIEDEYDPSAPEVQLTTPFEGAHVVPGLLHPDEVKEATGFEMPEGDYDTLAGFLLTLFDRIPAKGDHTSHEGWEFKVVEMEGKRIAQVLVVAPSEPAESDDS
jgi:CBS domain containing-hemolysin-like protein